MEAIEREIADRSAGVKQIEALKGAVAALEKEIDAIDRFKVARPRVLDLLKELTQIIPKSAWLTRVRTSDTSVSIEGYAESATGILSKLEASPYFKKVEFASPTFRDGRMNAERFVFKMEIEAPPVSSSSAPAVQPSASPSASNVPAQPTPTSSGVPTPPTPTASVEPGTSPTAPDNPVTDPSSGEPQMAIPPPHVAKMIEKLPPRSRALSDMLSTTPQRGTADSWRQLIR